MKINFHVGESSARFHREPILGRAVLLVDGEKTVLASLRDPATYFDYELVTHWTVVHGAHEIEVVKTRSRSFGGMRPVTYVVSVDGDEVATARGF